MKDETDNGRSTIDFQQIRWVLLWVCLGSGTTVLIAVVVRYTYEDGPSGDTVLKQPIPLCYQLQLHISFPIRKVFRVIENSNMYL
jgi:hypothetical protein